MNQIHSTYRYAIGLIAIFGGLGGLFTLFYVEVPPGNRDALMLALGVVLGWGGAVIQGEWGSSPAGLQMAQLGADRAMNEPIPTKVVNKPGEPIPTTDSGTTGAASG